MYYKNNKYYIFVILYVLCVQSSHITASESNGVVLAMDESMFQDQINALRKNDPWCAATLWLASRSGEVPSSNLFPQDEHPLLSSNLIQKVLAKTKEPNLEILRKLILLVYHQRHKLQLLKSEHSNLENQLSQLREQEKDPCGIREKSRSQQRSQSSKRARKGPQEAYQRLTPRN